MSNPMILLKNVHRSHLKIKGLGSGIIKPGESKCVPLKVVSFPWNRRLIAKGYLRLDIPGVPDPA